jgi:catechol 2,3-dioxygenase-like lactoylglutathione lyase family enzyme
MPVDLVQNLSVVLLLARDTSRTASFYRDVLGLPLMEEEHGDRPKHYACRLGSIYFTIQLADDLAGPAPAKGYDFLQLCFTVTDLDAFTLRLEELKIVPLHAPRQFEHTTFTTLLDPDGRHVRVMTPWGRNGSSGR